MVRAGVVDDPADWPESGYAELLQDGQRYQLLDCEALGELLGVADRSEIRKARRTWVEETVRRDSLMRDSCWSESLAIGDEEFVVGVKAKLGFKGRQRTVKEGGQGFVLRENETSYSILPPKTPL